MPGLKKMRKENLRRNKAEARTELGRKHTFSVRVFCFTFFMKLIIAIVRPHRLDEIVCAVEDIENFPGMTIVDSEGFGQRLRVSSYDAISPFKPNKRIEIACNDEMLDQIVEAIRAHAHTGKKGDGIILIVPVENAVLI